MVINSKLQETKSKIKSLQEEQEVREKKLLQLKK